MRKKLFFATVVAMALVSCNEKSADVLPADGMVELEVNVPVLKTRLTGTPASEAAVTNLQVFVFDKTSGTIEAYGNQNAETLKLKCLPGDKSIVAMVNAPSYSGASTLEGLQKEISSLSENAAGKLVMCSDVVSKTLTASDKTLEIDVSRIAAKVNLVSVTNNMALEVNQKKEFVVTAVYLINVAGEWSYFGDHNPDVWYNKMKYESSNSQSFLYDAPKAKIEYGKAYSTAHHFYCYPNHTETDANEGQWSARKTRLVVEATLGGETCYYPVTLAGVDRNTEYSVSLTVTRPGSSSPDIPVTTEEATFTVKVKDWIDGIDYTETI